MDIEDLTCPITRELLEDPIITPCCGRAISREPMVMNMVNSDVCPMCRENIVGFNASTAPRQINIAYMVEAVKAGTLVLDKNKPPVPVAGQVINEWKAKIEVIDNIGSYGTIVGQLQIYNTDDKFRFKTLLLPVIDKSGSMAGSPMTQVHYSLNRIIDMAFKYPELLTTVITYDDRGSHFDIKTTTAQAIYRDQISKINAGGGTSFNSGFEQVLEVAKKYNSDQSITKIIIIFLSDGEDSAVQKNNRGTLVSKFKENISQVWTKDYTVHSVGFGGSHDYDFLNALRQIGTHEGAYRYADPSENSDALSNKINSLLDVIVTSSTIPVNIINNAQVDLLPIIANGTNSGSYWLNMTKYLQLMPPPSGVPQFTISVNGEAPIQIEAEVIKSSDLDPEKSTKLRNSWYTHLVDEIATQLLDLSNPNRPKMDELERKIHCELLEQRCKAIAIRLPPDHNDNVRLAHLLDNIHTVAEGGIVNQQKLNDIKFEGVYATKQSAQQPKQTTTNSYSNNTYSNVQRKQKYGQWNIIERRDLEGRRYDPKVYPLSILAQHRNTDVYYEIHSNSQAFLKSNVLLTASSIGRCNIVKKLLEMFDKSELSGYDGEGRNALDLALLYGHYNTARILAVAGLTPSDDKVELIFRTAISHGKFITAELMLEFNFVKITQDMLDNVPTSAGLQWLSARADSDIPIDQAISKGVYDMVKAKLATCDKISISKNKLTHIFEDPTPDHPRIVDLLLGAGKLDLMEEIPIRIATNDGTYETEITWPLFIAAENGRLEMVKVLLKYIKKLPSADEQLAAINYQNSKGTTALWISACNRHIDIVMQLLEMGANPNLANLKGDSPLIPACQKGSDNIVELLLEAGADMNVYNKNRDNPVLICCRTGQANILRMLLGRVSQQECKQLLDTYAEIDGFVPLLASTELDKTECIKVCHSFGANLETMTADTNPILSGGTAFHLACHYGRLASAKVLEELGADICSKTANGSTPLHLAIIRGHINIVRYLMSLEKAKDMVRIEDNEGRLPEYYANIAGNEAILEEFFTNKMAKLMEMVLLHNDARYNDILVKYGQSIGCYEYSEITGLKLDSNGSSLLTHSLLYGNKDLTDLLLNKMNASMDIHDDYGLSPRFWIKYFGQSTGQNLLTANTLPNMNISDETDTQLTRVSDMAKKSIQNKMLLNLTNKIGNSQILEGATKLQIAQDTLSKMNDGYAIVVAENVLTNLKESQELDHSLYGFLEKLKNNKNFPDGKQYLEYILWEARTHLIKLVATGVTELQPVHIMALYLYTSNAIIFKQVNQTLLDWDGNSIWQPLINNLFQAIHYLPPYENEVYRAVSSQFKLDEFQIGSEIAWNTFSMTSNQWKSASEQITKKSGIIFIIKSKTGRLINKYSKYPVDGEVIFLPGTRFTVTNHYSPNIICLGQANIRNTTFKIKPSDYDKAHNGQASIIVELEECV